MEASAPPSDDGKEENMSLETARLLGGFECIVPGQYIVSNITKWYQKDNTYKVSWSPVI